MPASDALLTDLYCLTMAADYLHEGTADDIVTFELSARSDRALTVAGVRRGARLPGGPALRRRRPALAGRAGSRDVRRAGARPPARPALRRQRLGGARGHDRARRHAAAAPDGDAPGGDARRVAAAGGDELRRARRHQRDADRARRRRTPGLGLLDAPARRPRRRPQRRARRLPRRLRRHRHDRRRARSRHPGDRHDGPRQGHGARPRRRA